MSVTVTIGTLLNHGLWDAVCRITDVNEWAVNEGLADLDDVVHLTDKQAHELGLLPRCPGGWQDNECCETENPSVPGRV